MLSMLVLRTADVYAGIARSWQSRSLDARRKTGTPHCADVGANTIKGAHSSRQFCSC